jgi:hypothetical protein
MLTYIFDNSFEGSNNIKVFNLLIRIKFTITINKSKHLIVFFLNLEKNKFFE